MPGDGLTKIRPGGSSPGHPYKMERKSLGDHRHGVIVDCTWISHGRKAGSNLGEYMYVSTSESLSLPKAGPPMAAKKNMHQMMRNSIEQ